MIPYGYGIYDSATRTLSKKTWKHRGNAQSLLDRMGDPTGVVVEFGGPEDEPQPPDCSLNVDYRTGYRDGFHDGRQAKE
jgi:hypothetical protein